jgi:hypothetical protein
MLSSTNSSISHLNTYHNNSSLNYHTSLLLLFQNLLTEYRKISITSSNTSLYYIDSDSNIFLEYNFAKHFLKTLPMPSDSSLSYIEASSSIIPGVGVIISGLNPYDLNLYLYNPYTQCYKILTKFLSIYNSKIHYDSSFIYNLRSLRIL